MDDSIRKALAYLYAAQQEDGSFVGYSSPTTEPFIASKSYCTVFVPALVLGALAELPESQMLRNRLASWLLAQRGPGWSFNYWAQDAPERQAMPYPDDLDDTFCAISSLYRHDPSLIDAAALGEIVQMLVATETQVGGPYRTWLVTSDAPVTWQDVNLAVNANIAYFLRMVADPLPNVTALMDQAITTQDYNAPYYPEPMPVAYFIARAYTGRHARMLSAFIRNQQPRNALHLALQCSALARLGVYEGMTERIERLLALQQDDGSWPADAFCLDAAIDGKAFYHGAQSLSTAFALEAVHLYTARPAPTKRAHTSARPLAYQKIITAAKRPFAGLQDDLRQQCESLVDLMAKGDHSQEIVTLPQLFAASLAVAPSIPAATLEQLSLANAYGWIAYTIFDDFLDEEGNPLLLPAATASLRASLDAFAAAVPQAIFQQYVRETFHCIDGANAWEVAHCRQPVRDGHIHITALPRYGKMERLAERSLGHTLTPIAVLVLAGHNLHDSSIIAMQKSLRHYLIARQLQDDMYDWERDLRSGHMNAVVVEILRDLRLRPGEYAFTRLVPRMLNAYWQRILPVMCTRTLRHLTAARKAASLSEVLKPANPLYALYDRLEQRANDARASQTEAIAFLQAYKKPLA